MILVIIGASFTSSTSIVKFLEICTKKKKEASFTRGAIFEKQKMQNCYEFLVKYTFRLRMNLTLLDTFDYIVNVLKHRSLKLSAVTENHTPRINKI